jgi:[protein-PII] uridylyltransferase
MALDQSQTGLEPGQIAIEKARLAMGRELAAGASGTQVCRSLSGVYDTIVTQLWEAAIADILGADECGFALVALGGWGREEMCPYSDIDFLILAESKYEDIARELADKILYPLWDSKVNVGHAVRSSSQAARLARDDLPTATALLDARLVVGSESAFRDLVRATRRSVAPGGNANLFVSELRAEQERRHARFGDSLYLLEPNVKQGIGGLRDFNTAHWAVRARWSVPSISALVELGELTRRQAEVMRKGLDFLLEIRCLVQLDAGRGTDQLSFEIQESIGPQLFPYVAPAEGRVVPSVAPAVETLMRKYYLTGRGIERITNRLLESATVPERRKPRIRKIDRSFLSWNGKLAVAEPAVFRDEPSEMLRYFRVARQERLPLYGHTQELIEAEVAASGHKLFGDAKAARYFLDALTDLQDTTNKSLLREMHAVGLLAAVMPEFGPCTGRVQHDLYHVYTVDHHQLFAVEMLKLTGRGELGADGALAMEAYQRVERLETLFLGTLLHDVGKPLGGGHAESGAQIAARTATSLGMSEADVATVDFLVRQHLSMTHLSQRRDLSDPEVIEKFAKLVSTLERWSFWKAVGRWRVSRPCIVGRPVSVRWRLPRSRAATCSERQGQKPLLIGWTPSSSMPSAPDNCLGRWSATWNGSTATRESPPRIAAFRLEDSPSSSAFPWTQQRCYRMWQVSWRRTACTSTAHPRPRMWPPTVRWRFRSSSYGMSFSSSFQTTTAAGCESMTTWKTSFRPRSGML